MGRKAEKGISYYQLKCNHTSNKKIKLLIHDHDTDGYWIWQCILSYGYRKFGYYFDLNDADEVLLFSDDDCKKPLELVRNVIESCLNRGLFDRDIYQRFNILTSDHMQEIYLFATAERRRKGTIVEFTKEHLLIEITADTRNISIVPCTNGIVPRNNNVSPRINSDTSQPVGEEFKLKELKIAYAGIVKDKLNVYNFINNHRPTFIDPYVDMWNIFAVEYKKPKISAPTKKRLSHFNARIREKQFDFLKLLAKAKASSMCLEAGWFTFDFLIKNTDGYIKLLEGNYDNKQTPTPVASANNTDERLKNLLEQQ